MNPRPWPRLRPERDATERTKEGEVKGQDSEMKNMDSSEFRNQSPEIPTTENWRLRTKYHELSRLRDCFR